MKPNKPVFCLPESKFKVGDCVVYSDDFWDDVPYQHNYRDWARVVITGAVFTPIIRDRDYEYGRGGWWYSGVIFDGPKDGVIGHHCGSGEMINESDIRFSSKRPSDGFLAFIGYLWLPTEQAAEVLNVSPRTLTRKRSKLREGIHYLGSTKSYLWNVGHLSKALGITLSVPEIERSNLGRESLRLSHPNSGYRPFAGVFPVPTPKVDPIIVPFACGLPPLCG